MDALAISVSHGLQYGVPLAAFVKMFTNMRFEPAGMTDDPDLRFASSIVDYIFRRLAIDYLPLDERMELGILSVGERTEPTLPGIEEATTETSIGYELGSSEIPVATQSIDLSPKPLPFDEAPITPALERAFGIRPANADAPFCNTCGIQMQRAGSCHACPSCGSTSGCS
jgi:ribonucleoside-diphosphate reductase alpha chain